MAHKRIKMTRRKIQSVIHKFNILSRFIMKFYDSLHVPRFACASVHFFCRQLSRLVISSCKSEIKIKSTSSRARLLVSQNSQKKQHYSKTSNQQRVIWLFTTERNEEEGGALPTDGRSSESRAGRIGINCMAIHLQWFNDRAAIKRARKFLQAGSKLE